MTPVRCPLVLSVDSGFGVYCRSCALTTALVFLVISLLYWMRGDLHAPIDMIVGCLLLTTICIAYSMFVERRHRQGFAGRVLLLDDSLLVYRQGRCLRITLLDVIDVSDRWENRRGYTHVEYVRLRYLSSSGLALSLDFLPRPDLRGEEFNRSEVCALIMRAKERAKHVHAA